MEPNSAELSADDMMDSASFATDRPRRDLTIDQYCAGIIGGDFTVLARADIGRIERAAASATC